MGKLQVFGSSDRFSERDSQTQVEKKHLTLKRARKIGNWPFIFLLCRFSYSGASESPSMGWLQYRGIEHILPIPELDQSGDMWSKSALQGKMRVLLIAGEQIFTFSRGTQPRR